MDVSAVCQYQIADVKKVFEGSYKEYREAAQRWGRYTGAVPVPRPGAVRVEGGWGEGRKCKSWNSRKS